MIYFDSPGVNETPKRCIPGVFQAGATGMPSAVQIGGGFPAFHFNGDEFAALGEFGDSRSGVGGGEAEVIPKIGFGGDAQQMPLGFLDGGCRGVQDFCGKNPFGQVVDAFEVPPRGRGHLPYPKQPFKTHLGAFPSPPR